MLQSKKFCLIFRVNTSIKQPENHFIMCKAEYISMLEQAATIRLPDCPGQPLFGLGNHDVQYRRIAQLGKFKLKVSLHQSYHTSYKTVKNMV